MSKKVTPKMRREHPFRQVVSHNGFRVNVGYHPLRREARYLIGIGGQWERVRKMAQRKLLEAIDSNNDKRIKQFITILNVYCDHNRTVNIENGFHAEPFEFKGIEELTDENINKLRETVRQK